MSTISVIALMVVSFIGASVLGISIDKMVEGK